MQTMAPMRRLTRPDDLLEQLQEHLREATTDLQRHTLERRIRVTQKACEAATAPIELTERDIAVLRFLGSVRFATTEQIVRFAGGSAKNISARLNKLFVRQYVARPRVQGILLQSFVDLGNANLIYTLGPVGKKVLAQLGDEPKRHSRGKSPLIPHTLATAEFVLACLKACREQPNMRSLHHHDLVPHMPERTRALDDPFRLRSTLQQIGKPISCNVIPDWMFSLFFDDNTRLNFAVEIDRGFTTVAVRERGKIIITGKRTYARKLAGYYQGYQDDRFLEQWGFERLRVLSVVPSLVRIQHILEAQLEITDGHAPAMFLYTTPERITGEGLLAPIWISAEHDGISLLERK